MRKERDLAGTKSAVAQLNNYLGRAAGKVEPLSDTERDLLTRQLNLTPDELKEVTSGEFTSLDSYYLDQCLLFHDGVRSLGVDLNDESEAAQLARARVGYAWTMRQVWRSEHKNRPAPPSFALRRGSGSDIERAGVALAAFNMIGIDGCLVGRPGDVKSTNFWAVGARVGNEIYCSCSLPKIKR